MAALDWQLTHAGDATLVELLVTSETDTRVEIESNLQPVWPPRRRGRLAEGWSETGFTGSVAAGEVLVLGYASPADPVEPPATIVEGEPVDEQPEDPPTPQALVRSLGEAGPPRDAVPLSDGSSLTDATPGAPAGTSPQATDTTGRSADSDTLTAGRGGNGGSRGHDQAERLSGPAVEAWLDEVERRIDTAERLAAADSVSEARAAVDAAGGIDEVRRLCETLSADRERLDAVEARGETLGQRLAAVDVPLSALERLA